MVRRVGRPRGGDVCYGILLSMYLLSGRWGPGRASLEPTPFYGELRFWIVLLLAGFLFQNTRHASVPRRPYRGLWALLIAFFAYVLLSLLWSPNFDVAAKKGYEVLMVGLATASFAHVLSQRDGRVIADWLWIAIAIVAGGLLLIGMTRLLGGAAGERLAVLGGGPNVFARIMGFLVIASLVLWRRHGFGLLLLPVVCSASLLVLLTGSRGSLLALAAAVVVFVALELRSVRRLAFFSIVSVGVLSSILAYTPVGRAALDTYDQRVNVLLFQERYASGREDLYRAALELGAQEPVFGAGLAAFPALDLGVYPHNVFLEMYCEAGLVGLSLLGMFLGGVALVLVRSRRAVDGGVAAGLVMILIASQFSGDFYDSRALFLFAVAAVLVRSERDKDVAAHPARRPLPARPFGPSAVAVARLHHGRT